MFTRTALHGGLMMTAVMAATTWLLAANANDQFPRFDRVLLLEPSAETSANVSIGDLNGDGVPDLVLAKGRHWPLLDRVLLNDGHGRFPTAFNLGGVPDRSYSVTLADLDGDGDLDGVVGNDAPDPKRAYADDGTGHFTLLSTFGRPEWPTRNATAADLNGDGRPDIIVANRTDDSKGSNYVCLNRGKGHFDADCIAFSHESATTVTPADVNRDGFIDLIVPHRDGGQSYVYLNDGKANFSRRVPFGPPDAAIRVADAADLDGDGRIDIVAIDERRGAFIFFNNGDLKFSAPVPLTQAKTSPYALAVGDLNLDGKIDVVVGHVEAASVVYFTNGTRANFTAVPFGDNKGAAYGFAIGDLDRDGHPDIAVARSDAPNVVYFATPPKRNAELAKPADGSDEAGSQTQRIGIIDFYGLRRVSEASVRAALTVKEGDSVSIEDGGGPRFRADSERRLSGVPGVLRAHVSPVCCDAGSAIVYVGIEETGAPAWHFRTAPNGNVRLPADVVRTDSDFSRAMFAAIQRGEAQEEIVDGIVLMHDPAAQAIQRRFVDFARDLPPFRDVLRRSSDAEHRALATVVLGYAANPRDVIDDLLFAIDDPSESVRNNAMRAVWTMARARRDAVRVPFAPIVRLLSSPLWSDRNKASLALMELSANRDPALLAALRRDAMASLVEMARWKSKGHAIPALLMLGRIGGHSDDEAEAAWDRGDREAIIRDANRER